MNNESTKKSPWWLLPNLLSLDAPLLAVLWMWLLAKSMRVVYMDSYSYWLLAGAIWCVYVVDRVWDVRRFHSRGGDIDQMSTRHRFHWKYRKILLPLVLAVVVYGIHSAFNVASAALLTAGVSGIGLCVIYILVRAFDTGDIAYAKNFIAGITFAFGVSAPIVVESVQLPLGVSDLWYHFTASSDANFFLALKHGIGNFFKMTISTVAVVFSSGSLPFLFGLLCFLNITGIDLWEKSRRSKNEEEKESCETIFATGALMLAALAVYLAAYSLAEFERPASYVVMVAATLLYLINKKRSIFYLDAQRVLADFAMILPIPLWWFFN